MPQLRGTDSDQGVAVRDVGLGLEPVQIADTTRPNTLPSSFGRAAFAAFLAACKAGEFDHLTSDYRVAGDLSGRQPEPEETDDDRELVDA